MGIFMGYKAVSFREGKGSRIPIWDARDAISCHFKREKKIPSLKLTARSP